MSQPRGDAVSVHSTTTKSHTSNHYSSRGPEEEDEIRRQQIMEILSVQSYQSARDTLSVRSGLTASSWANIGWEIAYRPTTTTRRSTMPASMEQAHASSSKKSRPQQPDTDENPPVVTPPRDPEAPHSSCNSSAYDGPQCLGIDVADVLPYLPQGGSVDPEGSRPDGPAKDPSGKLIHDPSGRLVNTASGRLVPEQLHIQLKKQQQQQQQQPDCALPEEVSITSRTTFATTRTTQSGQPQPLRRVRVPNSADSVAQSTLTGDSLVYLGAQAGRPHQNMKEFLLLVEFHWKPLKPWCWYTLQPDHPTLPYVLHPYMRTHHWQVFLEAVVRLATRNHRVGTIYLTLGVLANLAGLAYIIYGLIPLESKFCSTAIAVGAGAGLLVAGLSLCVWGRANRGGTLFAQDMEHLCHNVSDQVSGVTVQFRSAASLKRLCDDEDDHSSRSLLFGLELFCNGTASEELGEDRTVTSTHPAAVPEVEEDIAHVVGTSSSDLEQPSSSSSLRHLEADVV